MKNYIQEGDVITVAAPAAVSSGELVIMGALAGVANTDAASGAPVALSTEGVYELPKKLSATFASGGMVSYDVSAKHCDAPGSGRYPIGFAVAAAGNGAATVKVRLDGTATAAA